MLYRVHQEGEVNLDMMVLMEILENEDKLEKKEDRVKKEHQ